MVFYDQWQREVMILLLAWCMFNENMDLFVLIMCFCSSLSFYMELFEVI